MTDLADLRTKLFVLKQELRLIEGASADAKQAAREPSEDYSPESYLSSAASLDMDADALRMEIAELEAETARLS